MIDSERYRIVIGAFSGSGHGKHGYLEEAARRGLAIYGILERRSLDVGVLRQIMAWCRNHRVDLVHTHDFRSDLYGLVAAWRLGIPVVATCHGWIANNLKGRAYTAVDKILLRYFECVIAVSERMREHLLRYGVAAERIAVIQNALILEDYVASRGDKAMHVEWGIPQHHRLIGTIGRLSKEKCQDLFLRAAAGLARDVPNVSFVLVGIGPEEARLRSLAVQLGIADRVRFAGYCADMQRVYNSLDLVVQSSGTEGMPNVILEALLMRVPVVATDVGGTSEIVRDGISGRLVRPHDLEGLVDAMRWSLTHATQSQAWAEAGERHVRTNFSHGVRLQRIRQVYDRVLGTADEHD